MVTRIYKCPVCGYEEKFREAMNESKPHLCCGVAMKSVPQIAYTTYNKKGKVDK